MIKVPLAEVKDGLSKFVRKAAENEVLITRHGKPLQLLSAVTHRLRLTVGQAPNTGGT
jgi:antitoxin (DNA-binding transcriptional repressor) of toxin-antitoxin stability system